LSERAKVGRYIVLAAIVLRWCEAVAAPIFERFEQQRLSQQQLAERLKFLSPAILTQIAMSEVADSGTSAYANFARQAQT
jgi:ABC-2 type transport system permease protein